MKRKRTRRASDSGVPGGGAGRKEEVRGSGVHPMSGAAAPENSAIRTPGEWGKGAGGEEGGRSELIFTEEELKRAREGGTQAGEGQER